MARIEESDVVDGSSYVEDGDGPRVVRVFQVVEVSGSRDARHAIAANVSGIPIINEFHPSIFLLQCVSKKAVSEGATTFKVLCEYKRLDTDGGEGSPSPQTQVTVGATLQQEQTNVDFEGGFLQVDYTAKLESDGITEIPEDKRSKDPQRITIDKSVPMTFVRFQRREEEAPENESEQYVGKLNSSSFLGGNEKTFLCTRIEGTSDDGGETYNVNYDFQRRQEGWDVELYYKNSEGKVPKDVNVGGNGYSKKQIYKSEDFNQLGLQ